MWKANEETTSHIAYISLRAYPSKDWYFDNDFSEHMENKKELLERSEVLLQ